MARGQANGFKPKGLKTRIGELQLAVPQVRNAKFYPKARGEIKEVRSNFKCNSFED